MLCVLFYAQNTEAATPQCAQIIIETDQRIVDSREPSDDAYKAFAHDVETKVAWLKNFLLSSPPREIYSEDTILAIKRAFSTEASIPKLQFKVALHLPETSNWEEILIDLNTLKKVFHGLVEFETLNKFAFISRPTYKRAYEMSPVLFENVARGVLEDATQHLEIALQAFETFLTVRSNTNVTVTLNKEGSKKELETLIARNCLLIESALPSLSLSILNLYRIEIDPEGPIAWEDIRPEDLDKFMARFQNSSFKEFTHAYLKLRQVIAKIRANKHIKHALDEHR